MKNVELKLDGNILTIKVDLTKEFGLSASGKTIIMHHPKVTSQFPARKKPKLA